MKIKIDIAKIIKRNLSIIIPSAIAVAAVVLLVPTVMMRSKISGKLEESKRLGQEVDSTLRTAVPSTQYQIVKQYQDKHAEDANAIKNMAVQSSQRELFSYKIFPEPNDTSIQIFNEFKRDYDSAFKTLIKQMDALDAPSDIEIQKEAGTSVSDTRRTSRRGGSNINNDDKIVELLCKRRSEEIKTYANPQVFSGYDFWSNWEYVGVQNALRDCWQCQIAYWIHKDIVDTITKINENSEKVALSPVKRLLGVRFGSADAANVGVENAVELPEYATENGGLLCVDWTGRKTDDTIDVLQFSVAVIVKADSVLEFMNALCSEKEHYFCGYDGTEEKQKFKHNQITILQSNISAIDRQDATHQKYRYGQDAVVHLNLICQYFFNKEGYEIIKPEIIKTELGQSDDANNQRQGRSRRGR